MSSIFSGWFQLNFVKNYKIFRMPFKIKENWFVKLYDKHYTKDIQVKFNPELFVDQDRGKAEELLNEIKFDSLRISQYKNELRILSDWLEDFLKVYNELKDFLRGENIAINTTSEQYEQLELLLKRIPSIKEKIQEQKNILNIGIKSEETSLPNIAFDHEYNIIGFDVRRIDEYEEGLKFIKEIPSELYPIVIVFRRQSEILDQIQTLNSLNSDFFNTLKIIHGKAGMGKSNISAYLTTSLKKEKHPVIIVKAKSFDGSPDRFNKILMEQLLVPNNYSIEEVLEKINNYGKTLNKRIVIIIDGLNETTYDNEGFSKIWEKSLDAFIELLKNYKFIYFVSTLRTSYISRIWTNNQIPYPNFELTGFNDNNLETVIKKYFDYYKIGYDQLLKGDIFYFKTPLLIDLYCQMLNPKKDIGVKAVFGLNGFKDVFERYISNLSDSVKRKLTLGTTDQIIEGIDRCSDAMLNNMQANIPKMSFYSLMQNEKVVKVGGTIGDEILSEYLIYLDENHKRKDVVIHTQQEVGGYLLAKELIRKHGSIDDVFNSDFFKERIIGDADLHQLKDDILKFLLIESNEYSIVFEKYIDNPIVKKFTLITLETEKVNAKTLELKNKISGNLKTKDEINELLNGLYSTFFDLDSPLNFTFIKLQLIQLDSSVFEYTWSKFIYDNYYEIDSIVLNIVDKVLLNDEFVNKELYIDFLIWNFETTIRELRDKVYVVLLAFFEQHPNRIFDKVIEYSTSNKPYIYERLLSLCYGISLIHQNNDNFIQTTLRDNIGKIYELQFGKNPKNPVYNYIVIDCIKHIVDFAILKGVFIVSDDEFNDFNNYRFELNNWFDVDEQDKDAVRDIYLHWTMHDKPDPLRGDFVHYTIPRLEERDGENRLRNTAHIYKHILKLGYNASVTELNKEEIKFRNGASIYGVEDKIDRLGKKYSWISFFDYAGYLLNEGRLNIWQEEDSEFQKHYDRLGDVEIEITNPKPVKYNEKLTDIDLFSHKNGTQDWVYKPMYSSLSTLFEKEGYTLLSGFINQRETESYDSRSFLLINSFFIKKDSITGNIEKILNKEYDWREDVITSNSSLSKVYFGELYWADNIPSTVLNHKDLPVEEEEKIERMITPFDILHCPEKFKKEDLNKFIKVQKKKRISFELEPTLIDYSWESNSKIISSISSTVPNVNIGKQLGLRADVTNLQILDKNGTLAHKSFEFEENYYTQNYEYLRNDLLIEYMNKNNYLLVYQVKQHTYDRNSGDGSGDFRGMQFFLSSLNK